MQPIYDFIADAQSDGKPFFVWYAPMLPHTPHNPPERLLAKYQDKTPSPHVAKYWAMVEWFDETCGQLLDHLDKQGLAENTIVCYVTDNGWIQDPNGERLRPVQAVAVRRRAAHADHGPLARQGEAGPATSIRPARSTSRRRSCAPPA